MPSTLRLRKLQFVFGLQHDRHRILRPPIQHLRKLES